ncbi:hypothetical protein DFJ73DRAFT_769724 [Zopfochytrium polystomum]|nr:hypothetical protein DFJ73DRAFT_769724 [Zopfochytrium polystomum]
MSLEKLTWQPRGVGVPDRAWQGGGCWPPSAAAMRVTVCVQKTRWCSLSRSRNSSRRTSSSKRRRARPRLQLVGAAAARKRRAERPLMTGQQQQQQETSRQIPASGEQGQQQKQQQSSREVAPVGAAAPGSSLPVASAQV